MKLIVISLGGSIINPDDVDYNFLKEFRETLTKQKKLKFIIVTGGGATARRYIKALRADGLSNKIQCLAGIAITRFHARFLMELFKNYANKKLPTTIKEIGNLIKKDKIVFCGALRYEEDQTSDAVAAEIAAHFKAPFVNLTDVDGLYDKDPKKHWDAQLISKISYKDFHKIIMKIKYEAGLHFVLDHKAADIAMKKKVKTFILNKNMGNFENFLKGKKYKGTVIA
ncbi:MAG TPA: UMP kinase [Candidatus Nanoarchaeia archaeon]|nr:UMP kinase [Candidatus Nanoarchaeia archaeon]